MDNKQIMADRIRQLAKERNITVKELLQEVGIKDKDFITKIEKGTNVGYVNILKLADKLDCSIDYLTGRTDEKSIMRVALPIFNNADQMLEELTKALEDIKEKELTIKNTKKIKKIKVKPLEIREKVKEKEKVKA